MIKKKNDFARESTECNSEGKGVRRYLLDRGRYFYKLGESVHAKFPEKFSGGEENKRLGCLKANWKNLAGLPKDSWSTI